MVFVGHASAHFHRPSNLILETKDAAGNSKQSVQGSPAGKLIQAG
jgi:hypothetical protein